MKTQSKNLDNADIYADGDDADAEKAGFGDAEEDEGEAVEVEVVEQSQPKLSFNPSQSPKSKVK